MCGTYAFRKAPREVRRLLREGWHPADIPDDAWSPSFKIKPSRFAPIAFFDKAGTARVSVMRWGFLPHWMAERGKATINAKAETVFERPMFRAAARSSRCIVLADGFYEPKGIRQPRPWYFFQRHDESLFGFAGIFAVREEDSHQVPTFAILTSEPNSTVAPIHGRMPVMLSMEDWDGWLAASDEAAAAPVLAPREVPNLDCWRVPDDAKKAASPDGPNCIAVVDE